MEKSCAIRTMKTIRRGISVGVVFTEHFTTTLADLRWGELCFIPVLCMA